MIAVVHLAGQLNMPECLVKLLNGCLEVVLRSARLPSGRSAGELSHRQPSLRPVFHGIGQRDFFVARLRGGVNRSATAAMADGTRR